MQQPDLRQAPVFHIKFYNGFLHGISVLMLCGDNFLG